MAYRGGGHVQSGKAAGAGYFSWSRDVEDILLSIVQPRLEAAADAGYATAVQDVPVRTGKLVSTISSGVRVYKGLMEAYVAVGTDYWQFVEYGTGLRGTASNLSGPVQSRDYQHGGSGGQQARPFMRPAMITMAEHMKGSA